MGRYPHSVTVDGREQISRAGAAHMFDLSMSHLANLWSQRAETGHPEPVNRIGPTLYWDRAQLTHWINTRRATDTARLTDIDTTGDPDELVTAAEAARILGYSGAKVILRYLTKNPGYFPDPDDMDQHPNGAPNRLWKRATVLQFAANRGTHRKGGRPPGTADTRPPAEPYAHHPFKPTAIAAARQPKPPTAAEFADHTGLPEHTARRLLAAARKHLTHNAQQP